MRWTSISLALVALNMGAEAAAEGQGIALATASLGDIAGTGTNPPPPPPPLAPLGAREQREAAAWERCFRATGPSPCEAYLAAYADHPRASLAAMRIRGFQTPPVPTAPIIAFAPSPDFSVTITVAHSAAPDAEILTSLNRANEWAVLGESFDRAALREFSERHAGSAEAELAAERLDWLSGFWAEGQAELNRIGYSAGPVDGIWGRKSARALRKFQRAQGLEVTGELTETVLAALRIAEPLPRPARPSQPTRPSNPRPQGGTAVVSRPTPITTSNGGGTSVTPPRPTTQPTTPARPAGSGSGGSRPAWNQSCVFQDGNAGDRDC